MSDFFTAVLSSTLVLGAASCIAAEGNDGLRQTAISGFGTLGYLHDNSSHHAIARDIGQDTAELDSKGSWLPDSRLGIQVAHTVSPTLELVGQVMLRDQAQSSGTVEWAFVGYRPLPELQIRAGRVGVDAFMMSDSRHIGYSYPWVRPPMVFYSWIPMYSINGVDVSWQRNQGDAVWLFKAQGGKTSNRVPVGGRIIVFATDAWDGTVSYEYGPLRFKLGHSRFRVSKEAPLDDLEAGLNLVAGAGLGPISSEAAQLVRDTTFKGARIQYSTIGAAYDDGLWQAQAEASRATASIAMIPQGTRSYISVGRRFGNLLPFVMFANGHAQAEKLYLNDWSALPFGAAELQAATISNINLSRLMQRSTSVGLRWDFRSDAAFKLQVDAIQGKKNGWLLWSTDRAFESKRIVLTSATVDFVF